MHFSELAWSRKSVRNFTSEDVSIEKIRKLLDAARSAPSGGNCQPWHFYVSKDMAMKESMFASTGRRQAFLLQAPVLIVVCVDLARTGDRYGERGRSLYGLQDTAAAIQNMLLCAVEEGLSSCWCGAFDEQIVSTSLQLSADMRPIALLPIGYAVNEPAKTSRRPIEEISTFIGFDEPPITQRESTRIKFEHADYRGALFNDLNLEQSEFVNLNMRRCSYNDINFSQGNITCCNLSNLEISNCVIDGLTINGRDVSETFKK